nr:hypothetical protein [Escherichia coli]
MYAKSFIALDGNGRLTGARTAQAAPYANYTCHLCGSALRYHPQYDTCNFAFFSGLIDAQFWTVQVRPKSPELTANCC